MPEKEKNILSRFIAEEETSKTELESLRGWLSDNPEAEEALLDEWENAVPKETEVQFSTVQNKIKGHENITGKKSFFQKVIFNYQKVAAIILLPALAVSIYFTVNHFNSEPTYFQTTAARGQKSQLVLPDGTKVWLNSDSQLKYPDNFGKRNRTVQLQGEAYFEVTSDAKNPFVVSAGEAKIKVLGTKFNLKAYPDEKQIETTLLEGRVELTIQPGNKSISAKTIKMKPGELLIFKKEKNELQYGNFESEEILAWTNNQLIFRNDSFENLVRKIERWYDVDIVYDEASLNNQRLTVELYQGELLYRLLDIIELAMNVECISEKDKIYIKTKNNTSLKN